MNTIPRDLQLQASTKARHPERSRGIPMKLP